MNHDGSYDELGGGLPEEDQTDAWDVGGAIYEACEVCGAERGFRCTVETASGRRERGMPCLGRLKGQTA
jgi:hypothetical protein